MSDFEELTHRINNLLGTISVQADVARADGSLRAHQEALRFIAESAEKTQQMLRELLAQRSRADGAGPDRAGHDN